MGGGNIASHVKLFDPDTNYFMLKTRLLLHSEFEKIKGFCGPSATHKMARCPSFGYAVFAGPLKRQGTLLASTSRLLVVSALLSAQCIIASPVACGWGVSLDQAAAALDAGAKSAQCMDLFLTSAPSDLHYTVNVLRANAAALEGDGFGWVDSVNTVLAHWNTTAVRLLARARQLPGDVDLRLPSPSAAIDFVGDLAPQSQPEPVMHGPLVSVVMVAHNAAATVRAAAASILAQSWRRLELIIVDDASTDRTWESLHSIQATDPARVHLLRNRQRMGPYVSRNRALRDIVDGNYVTCHDADDWAHPDRLAVQLRPLLASAGAMRANVAYMLRVQPDGRLSTGRTSWFCPDGATKIAMVSAMYERRLLVEELGYWDSVWYGADAEMIGRAQALLGKAGFAEVRAIVMLCRDAVAGLGKAGYNEISGDVSDRWKNSMRYRYRISFTGWHTIMSNSTEVAYVPFNHGSRRFFAPEKMVVPWKLIGRLALPRRQLVRRFRFRPWNMRGLMT